MSTSFIIQQSQLFKNLMKTIKTMCWTDLVFTVTNNTLRLCDKTNDGCVFLNFNISNVKIGETNSMSFKSVAFLKILRTIKSNEPLYFLFDEDNISVRLLTTKYVFNFKNIETSNEIIHMPDLAGYNYFECSASQLNTDFNLLKGLIHFNINDNVLKMSNENISIFKSIDYDDNADEINHEYIIK